MEYPLDRLSGEKAHRLILYLNALLGRRTGHGIPPPGDAGVNEDGLWETRYEPVPMEPGGDATRIAWQLRQELDGTLVSLHARPADGCDIQGCRTAADAFFRDLLMHHISEPMQPFFRRRRFSYIAGQNLHGEYWLGALRIAPLYPDDGMRLHNAERVIAIDQTGDAVDFMHAEAIADERADRTAAHLSLILDVGISPLRDEYRYVQPLMGEREPGQRQVTSVMDPDPRQSMPRKGESCALGVFKGSVLDDLNVGNPRLFMPVEARAILRGRLKADEQERDAFDRASMLWQLALTVGRYHPTVRISYEVAAAESLATATSGAANKKDAFVEFVSRNCGAVDRQILGRLYGAVRSGHWHHGQFELGEMSFRTDHLTDPGASERFGLTRTAHRLLRTAILKWGLAVFAPDRVRHSPGSVKADRERIGFSAKDYGLLVGVSASTIYNWEKGKSKPQTRALAGWAAVRGIGRREAVRRLGLLGGVGA